MGFGSLLLRYFDFIVAPLPLHTLPHLNLQKARVVWFFYYANCIWARYVRPDARRAPQHRLNTKRAPHGHKLRRQRRKRRRGDAYEALARAAVMIVMMIARRL